MSKDLIETKKRGRPAVKIIWPTVQPFTVEDIINATGVEISKVAVQVKVNDALKKNLIKISGKRTTKTGRRPTTYELVTG